MNRRLTTQLLAALTLAASTGLAFAPAYPSKPVRWVVP